MNKRTQATVGIHTMIKIEMHCHTCFSRDSFVTPKTLTEQCHKKQLDCVCITDHDTMRGVVEFTRQVPVRIIAGEEVSTGQGDVIGLFLKEEIAPDLGLETTIERIKAQGGIVYLPHPFDESRKSAVKVKDAQKIKGAIDVIEVFNSRTLNPKYNKMAMEFATSNDILVVVGSDAHHKYELGLSYMEIENFNDSQSFLRSLKSAKYVMRRSPFLLRVYIKFLKIMTGEK